MNFAAEVLQYFPPRVMLWANISNVITDGIVIGSYSAGGIVGYSQKTAITNCTNYADIVNIGNADGKS